MSKSPRLERRGSGGRSFLESEPPPALGPDRGGDVRRPVVFNHVSVDGKFTGVNGDFSWAHEGSGDPEFASFLAANASRGGEVLFGRPGKGMAILGSGSIVSQLAAA